MKFCAQLTEWLAKWINKKYNVLKRRNMIGKEFLLAVLLLWLVPAVVLIIMMKVCAKLRGERFYEDEVVKALVPILNIVILVVSITEPLTEWLTKWINKDANVLN